jgi:hypothetical protein
VWLQFLLLFFSITLQQFDVKIDRIILPFRKPFLSFYIYLLLIWLFMFIFIFYAAFKQQNESIVKFVRSLPFWKCWNFGQFLRVCAHKHLPMCTGTSFLHIHHSPPYTFAQITPLNPIFMGHCFNLCWHPLLSHSNDFNQSNRVLLPKRQLWSVN